jgi:uncharacterized protein YjbI with pentapeptide repeats
MANKDHVARLKKSVADWKTWRELNANIHHDLSEANLSKLDLSGADLRLANLTDAS